MRKTVKNFQREVFEAVRGRAYVDLPPIIVQSYVSTVKLRFRIRRIRESFIQFYYNEDNGKTSMVLVVEGKRMYGHDYTPKRGWHRHVLPNGEHDYSEEGKKPVTVERVSKALGVSPDELVRRGIEEFLEAQLRVCFAEVCEVEVRYGVKSAGELEEKIRRGAVDGHPAWEDLIVLENLEERAEKIRKELRECC